MKNSAYNIVSESVVLSERFASPYLIGGLAAIGLHIGNKYIRLSNIYKRYPTPESLKAKLSTSDKREIVALSQTLTPGMTDAQYKQWIIKNCNPKLGIGKAIFLFLFPGTFLWQLGKAGIHYGEDGETLVNRAMDNGYYQ